MAIAELIGIGLLVKLLGGSKEQAPKPPDAPPRDLGAPPGGGVTLNDVTGAVGSVVGLGTTIFGLFGGGTAAAAPAPAVAAPAAGGATAGLSVLTTIVGSLIVAGCVAVVELALSTLTNAAIAGYFLMENRQKRKQLGATFLVTKTLKEQEARWNLLLIKKMGGVAHLTTDGIDTFLGEVELVQHIDSVSGISVEVQSVIAVMARYLAGVEVLAHHETVRTYFATSLAGFNPEEYADGISEATINSIIGARWGDKTTWGVTLAFSKAQADFSFSSTPGDSAKWAKTKAIARFFGRYSGFQYVLSNWPNMPPGVYHECVDLHANVAGQQQCFTDNWVARAGLNYLRQTGTWPNRWYIDDAAGLALNPYPEGHGLVLQRKSARVADIIGQGGYVPPVMEMMLNNLDVTAAG